MPVLSSAEIDGLLAEAREAEAGGRTQEALGSLTVAVAELLAQGKTYQYPFEWMARLESSLCAHEAADAAALVGRKIAEEASHGPGVLRMDVLRADIARRALDLTGAEAILVGLRGDDTPLGPISVERIDAIRAWLRSLHFRDHPTQNVAILRVEVALVIAELWSEYGKYISALRIIDAIEQDLGDAELAVRVDQVQLLRVELLIAAGRYDDAEALLAALPVQETRVDGARVALVRTRLALATGHLARAVAELEVLAAAPPGDPMLFAAAAAARVAVQAELNLLETADQIADGALATLSEEGPTAALELLEQAKHDAAARGRSAIALWELPFTSGATDTAPLPRGESVGARWRLTAAWTGAVNRILSALEQADVSSAAEEQAGLEELTREVESDYIACRVELSGALVDYYQHTVTMARMVAIIERLHAMGARLCEAQAVRFASWVAARQQRFDEYAVLARLGSEILDAIASELGPEQRACFLMNKWSGRDELVAARVRDLLRGSGDRSRRPTRRGLCRAFREIEELTHWPIDDALGDVGAGTLASDAIPELVQIWVRERLASVPARGRANRGVSLSPALSLWWFPARTLVLHYHVLPDRTYLFRIARRHIDVSILPVGRLHLAGDMREAAADKEQLRWLAEHTGITDAIARFPGIRRLVIVPHDAIANIPFAALPVADRPLCAVIPITQVDRLTRLWRRPRRPRSGPFLSVGRSDYQGAGLADLPSAEREADAVAAAMGTNCAARRNTTRREVLAELPGAARFHVAAHGVFDMADPAASGIVLDDGVGGYETLTLRELRRLDLHRLQLATLATCRSAEHARLPGRERICLPTALLDAGVWGVIASLWPVEDEPSLEVMAALYNRLRRQSAARALADMQAEMCDHRPARQWAGLVFYGNE
jgi:CHAT domain